MMTSHVDEHDSSTLLSRMQASTLRHLDVTKPISDHLSLRSDSSDRLAWMEALRKNTSIESIHVVLHLLQQRFGGSGDGSGTTATEEQKQDDDGVNEVYQTLGALSLLHEARFLHSGFAEESLTLLTTFLSHTKQLQSLTLHSLHFRDQVMYPLEKSKSNNDNTASSYNTNDEEFVSFLQGLSQLPCLERFTLIDVEDRWDLEAVLDVVLELPTIQCISVRSHSLPRLPRLTPACLEKLLHSPTLEELTLQRLSLGLQSEVMSVFAEMSSNNTALRKLCIGEDALTSSTPILTMSISTGTFENLSELQLVSASVTDQGGGLLIRSLTRQCCGILKVIDLTNNFLGEVSCKALTSVLEAVDCSLETISLAQNPFDEASSLSVLVSALNTNTSVKALNLSESHIDMGTCVCLAHVLEHNPTLETLHIAGNRLGNEAIRALLRALSTNTTLQSLNLCRNHLGNPSLFLLAEVLQSNSTLERLNLGSLQGVEAAALDALESTVRENWSLKHLWLKGIPTTSSIPSFLRLNKLGRKQLMDELDNATLWGKVLLACSNDLSCMFFLVRANPMVVAWLPTTTTT